MVFSIANSPLVLLTGRLFRSNDKIVFSKKYRRPNCIGSFEKIIARYLR